MLIECTIRRKGGSKLQFDQWPSQTVPNASPTPAASYHFKPVAVEGLDESDYPHVADVKHEAHIHRFLSISDGYRAYLPEGAELVIEKPAVVPVIPPKQQEEPAPVSAEVAKIRELTVRELKASINTFAEADLRAALALERARTDDPPRKTWCEVVEAQVGAA